MGIGEYIGNGIDGADGHFVFDTGLHIGHETVVARVHDLVDGKRCDRAIGML